MFKNKVKDLLKRIERKRTIQQELTSVTMALTRLNHDRIGNALVEARSRLASFINYRGNGSEHQVPEQRGGELKTLQENVAQLTKKYHELKAEKEGLSADFKRLQDELAALDYTADPVALADQHKEINRTRMVIADIETAIARQQEIIDNNQVESGENLQNHRQGILADQALGSNGKRDSPRSCKLSTRRLQPGKEGSPMRKNQL
ncbi:MAG: hypothetical protein KAV87_27110 [Desulfobacteraceae bacterium]|nr:hypothetical protein [Desulfobacteraceae bacterium]